MMISDWNCRKKFEENSFVLFSFFYDYAKRYIIQAVYYTKKENKKNKNNYLTSRLKYNTITSTTKKIH